MTHELPVPLRLSPACSRYFREFLGELAELLGDESGKDPDDIEFTVTYTPREDRMQVTASVTGCDGIRRSYFFLQEDKEE